MNKFVKIILIAFFALFLLSGVVNAAPFTFGPAGSSQLQGVLDGITVGPNPGVSSVNVETDALADSSDTLWSITAVGGSVSTVVVELAGFADDNIFGVYDATDPTNPLKQVEVFPGAAGAGTQSLVSIKADGSVFVNFVDSGVDFAGNLFGYFLDATANSDDGGGFWYSDTGLNSDGLDHMAAYQGKNVDTIQLPGLAAGTWTDNEFLLAWEDLDKNSGNPTGGIPGGIDFDGDYTDFVVMVESVEPIPEPATMLLLGSGLIGLAGFGRRKLFKK
jgi:hypothetical protein